MFLTFILLRTGKNGYSWKLDRIDFISIFIREKDICKSYFVCCFLNISYSTLFGNIKMNE